MERRAALRRYIVRIRKKVPLPLGGHGQPLARVCGLENRMKGGFQLSLVLVSEQLSTMVVGGVKLRPKLRNQQLMVPAIILCM